MASHVARAGFVCARTLIFPSRSTTTLRGAVLLSVSSTCFPAAVSALSCWPLPALPSPRLHTRVSAHTSSPNVAIGGSKRPVLATGWPSWLSPSSWQLSGAGLQSCSRIPGSPRWPGQRGGVILNRALQFRRLGPPPVLSGPPIVRSSACWSSACLQKKSTESVLVADLI